MYPKLMSLYGPFELNSYNSAMIVGLSVVTYLITQDQTLKKFMSKTAAFNLIVESALLGILGARLLHVISCWSDYPTFVSMLRLGDGGLSILGAFIAVFAYVYWSCGQRGLPIFEVGDIAAFYAPLFHGIARIGCFLVGCCHGAPTDSLLSITYSNPQVMAPLHCALHPTQLYSSVLFFLLFLFLYWVVKKFPHKPAGTVMFLYCMGMSLERFFLDFLRGDRIMSSPASTLSFHQWVAAAIFMGATTVLMLRSQKTGAPHESL